MDNGISGGIHGEGKTDPCNKPIILGLQNENFPLYPKPDNIFLAKSANFAPSEKLRYGIPTYLKKQTITVINKTEKTKKIKICFLNFTIELYQNFE